MQKNYVDAACLIIQDNFVLRVVNGRKPVMSWTDIRSGISKSKNGNKTTQQRGIFATEPFSWSDAVYLRSHPLLQGRLEQQSVGAGGMRWGTRLIVIAIFSGLWTGG